ncbi:hypothetical protein ACHAWF_013762 [Thalassiosira exigua]
MVKSEQHATALERPGSPIRDGLHSDYHSDLTADSDPDDHDENFISLLQYRDAHQVLDLTPDPQTKKLSTEIIEDAYSSSKQQTLRALEQCESRSTERAGGRNTFFVGQQNYLELKLKALDQAYKELMTTSTLPELLGNQSENADTDVNGMADRYAIPMEKSLEEKSPPSRAKEYVWHEGDSDTRDVTNAAARSLRTNSNSQTRNLACVPSEDELDTIDIYFRPSPNKKIPKKGRAKSPDHPSDVSSCTWEGSSIFSMISKTIQNAEEASDGGLSDVLGPVHHSSPERSRSSAPSSADRKQQLRSAATPKRKEDVKHQYSDQRPPSGVNAKQKKQGSPKAQISPKSVTDFPASMHNHTHYDNTSTFNTGKAVVGRGKMLKGQRRPPTHHNSHEATEAARMGILRALSEDNSECLSLEDEDNRGFFNASSEAPTHSRRTNHARKQSTGEERTTVTDSELKGPFFHGMSDCMQKESNSLMASVRNDKPSEAPQTNHSSPSGRGSATPNRNNRSSPTSLPSSDPSKNAQPKVKLAEVKSASSNDYDAVLQSSLDLCNTFADELCITLSSCLKGDFDLNKTLTRASSAASAALDVAASEFDRVNKDEESTIVTRSSFDESTNYNRSLYTEGESTAFNTMSSFSKGTRENSPTFIKNRKLSRTFTASPTPSTSSDPPPRMLV